MHVLLILREFFGIITNVITSVCTWWTNLIQMCDFYIKWWHKQLHKDIKTHMSSHTHRGRHKHTCDLLHKQWRPYKLRGGKWLRRADRLGQRQRCVCVCLSEGQHHCACVSVGRLQGGLCPGNWSERRERGRCFSACHVWPPDISVTCRWVGHTNALECVSFSSSLILFSNPVCGMKRESKRK